MTQNQYRTLAENFASFADIEVSFDKFSPQIDKYFTTMGILKGVGVGSNTEHFIIGWMGSLCAIHYSRIKFPKRS